MNNFLKADNSVPNSLNYAKYKVFVDICFRHEHRSIFRNYLSKNKYDFRGEKWTLHTEWFEETKVKNAKLMKQDPNGAVSNIYFNIGLNPIDDTMIYLNWVPKPTFGAMFDEICRLTNEGYSIGYYITPDKHSQISTKIFCILLKPYQGSELLIEADLSSPDYAYLDEKIDDVTFETEKF